MFTWNRCGYEYTDAGRGDYDHLVVRSAIGVLMSYELRTAAEQDYPGHLAWIEATEAQLRTGKKRAVVAIAGNLTVGVVIYQRDTRDSRRIEFRNISIIPDAQGQTLGTHIVRVAEHTARNRFPDATEFAVDTKVTNTHMRGFLEREGYQHVRTANLYGSDVPDAIYTKSTRWAGMPAEYIAEAMLEASPS